MAAAVVEAIEHDQAEIDVASFALRAISRMAALAPAFVADALGAGPACSTRSARSSGPVAARTCSRTASEVLRRYRAPRDTEREAAAMEHARAHGFPAPAARALNETDMVMERVSGPTMLADLVARPWRVGRHAATLAELHRRLHAIDGPDWLPSPLGDGNSLLHLDLHPDNVILSPSGPVVIDWPNAARGPGAADDAHTWIVLACSLPPEGLFRRAVSLAGRRPFIAFFLGDIDRDGHREARRRRRLPAGEPHAAGGGARSGQGMLRKQGPADNGPRRENTPSWPAGCFRVTEDLPR